MQNDSIPLNIRSPGLYMVCTMWLNFGLQSWIRMGSSGAPAVTVHGGPKKHQPSNKMKLSKLIAAAQISIIHFSYGFHMLSPHKALMLPNSHRTPICLHLQLKSTSVWLGGLAMMPTHTCWLMFLQ